MIRQSAERHLNLFAYISLRGEGGGTCVFEGDTIFFGGEGGVRKDTISLLMEWWVLSVYNSFDQLPKNRVCFGTPI